MGEWLSLEEARRLGSQEGNCTRLGSAHSGEVWHCSHCKKSIPGLEVVLDVDADAYACPRCSCWNSLIPPQLAGGVSSSLA